jgi:hypothetical protein
MFPSMKITATILIVIFVIATCSSRNNGSAVETSNKNLKTALANFKADHLGCLGLRDKNSIELIYRESELKGKSRAELLEIIGSPNDTVVTNGSLNLKYYFNRVCAGGTPVDSVETCWSNFHIDQKTQKVLDVEFVCQ